MTPEFKKITARLKRIAGELDDDNELPESVEPQSLSYDILKVVFELERLSKLETKFSAAKVKTADGWGPKIKVPL